MAIRTLSEKRVSEHMLERQMRNWEIARSQTHETEPAAAKPQAVKDFVTISRSVGLPGDILAQRLHERLGWPVFDREILRQMAGDDACREQIFRVLDERGEGWVQSFVRGFLESRFIGREAYFTRLVETVAALARSAPGIFMGRGVDLILPRHVGIRLRLSADRRHCARLYAAERSIPYETAIREIEAIERERARFIRQNFHILPEMTSRFDLIFNLERVSIDEAADVVFALLRARHIEP